MQPYARRDLRNLVRKLGASSRPSQERRALVTLAKLSSAAWKDDDPSVLAAIVGAGAIPHWCSCWGLPFRLRSNNLPQPPLESSLVDLGMRATLLLPVPSLCWWSC
ncbi:hypothetical protein FOA52_005675 [Chlamydomonas sp. UWO 241]|nr:hypothetical protein FOA52_005675 [Chlamydomonas sp. UWO 241]